MYTSYLKNLMKLRKESDLTLTELGEVIGISNQSVSRLERGGNVPSFFNLIAFADYFNVSIDYLIGRTENPKISK